jgi:hypothetical protein
MSLYGIGDHFCGETTREHDNKTTRQTRQQDNETTRQQDPFDGLGAFGREQRAGQDIADIPKNMGIWVR